MVILFIGDVVGRVGRKLLKDHLPKLQDRHHADFTIVNVENAAGGFGVTPQITEELLALEVDVMTSGNHIWDKREILEYLDMQPRLLRPHNYPNGVPGRGIYVGVARNGCRVATMNLQGRVFMAATDCPFRTADRELERLRRETPVIVVDFHAEATSEKICFGRYVDGRASAVIGTHTHVQTADEQVLLHGTAYLTDVGMTGPHDSVIGMEIQGSLDRFLTQIPRKFESASGNPILHAAVMEIDDSTGRALGIERISLASH
jgi:2',3'-cyclic-nucleotide 2'-phosphodiesterase